MNVHAKQFFMQCWDFEKKRSLTKLWKFARTESILQARTIEKFVKDCLNLINIIFKLSSQSTIERHPIREASLYCSQCRIHYVLLHERIATNIMAADKCSRMVKNQKQKIEGVNRDSKWIGLRLLEQQQVSRYVLQISSCSMMEKGKNFIALNISCLWHTKEQELYQRLFYPDSRERHTLFEVLQK